MTTSSIATSEDIVDWLLTLCTHTFIVKVNFRNDIQLNSAECRLELYQIKKANKRKLLYLMIYTDTDK